MRHAANRHHDSPAVPNVPLVGGLVTVSAVHEPDKGDYESILKVDEVSADLSARRAPEKPTIRAKAARVTVASSS